MKSAELAVISEEKRDATGLLQWPFMVLTIKFIRSERGSPDPLTPRRPSHSDRFRCNGRESKFLADPPQPEHAESVNNVTQGSSRGSERATVPVAALARAWLALNHGVLPEMQRVDLGGVLAE